jgi:hypothetical protein
MSAKSKVLYSLLVLVLIAGNVYFALSCASARQVAKQAEVLTAREKINTQTLDFMKVFIEKVVQTDKEVDFETRLDLENRVRKLNNQQVLDQWNNFTKSATEAQAQVEVKKLLLLLIDYTQSQK